MKIFIFIYVILLSFLNFSNLAYGSDIKLECEFTDYSRTTSKKNVVKSWINVNQSHYITGDSVSWSQTGLTGKIIENNDKRIKWKITTKTSMRNKGKVRITYSYVFF